MNALLPSSSLRAPGRLSLSALALAALLAGCSVGPLYHQPVTALPKDRKSVV